MKTPDDYWRFSVPERLFNEIQAGIRNLVSTWVLAVFAAIALLLKSEDKSNWLVSPAVLAFDSMVTSSEAIPTGICAQPTS